MSRTETRGEFHGCVVCGRLYELYVVYDEKGEFIDFKVMSAEGKRVSHERRPLVACQKHSETEIESAVAKAYGEKKDEDD